MQINNRVPELIIGIFALSYFLTFPSFFFSVDELSYVTRAMAFGSGQLDWVQPTLNGELFSWAPADYPLGTAFFLTPYAFLSKHLIFLSGLVYVISALLFIYKVLAAEKINYYLPYVLFFIFPPTIYFARGVMSEMPSLLLIAGFVYVFFRWEDSYKKYFLLGLLTTFSIWFRETNLVLCGGLVAIFLLQKPKWILIYSLGCLLGMVPRVLSAQLFYEKVGYVKQYAPFGMEYFLQNIPLYSIILLLLIPGGVYVLYRFHGRHAKGIKLALIAFTLLHLVYGYNSGDHSGFLVSLFYNGRYYIPTLPLWMIVYGDFSRQFSFFDHTWVKRILILGSLLFVVGTQVFYHQLEKAHRVVALDIFKQYNEAPIFYSNSAYRYLNPLHGRINQLAPLNHFQSGKTKLKGKSYLVLSHRNNTINQAQQWASQLSGLDHMKDELRIVQIERYTIFDGTNVVIFELSPL